jgi:DNA invertase Pin-like site-specific DNA recombinase
LVRQRGELIGPKIIGRRSGGPFRDDGRPETATKGDTALALFDQQASEMGSSRAVCSMGCGKVWKSRKSAISKKTWV